jgi:hypothetical protein
MAQHKSVKKYTKNKNIPGSLPSPGKLEKRLHGRLGRFSRDTTKKFNGLLKNTLL